MTTKKTPGQLAYEAYHAELKRTTPQLKLQSWDKWYHEVQKRWDLAATAARADLVAENERLRSIATDLVDAAEMRDKYEQYLLDIGKSIGCEHLDEQIANCIIHKLQGDDEATIELQKKNERRQNAHEELSRRYNRSLKLLKRAYKAFNRLPWQDGEADSEVTEAISDLFAEEMLERDTFSKEIEHDDS